LINEINFLLKRGRRVSCIGNGLHIECIVIRDPGIEYLSILVLDPVTNREVWVSRNQIDYDKQYYRDKALKELGI
jgi:hypothetical protein